MSRRLVAWYAAAFLSVGAAVAQGAVEPRLTVRLKPLRAEIGDRVEAELELVVPAGLAVGSPIFPSWGDSWGDLEVVTAADPVPDPAAGGATRFRQKVTLTPWQVGELALPPPVVEVPTASEILQITPAGPATLTVGSVLPEGEERPGPKPPAPPMALPIGRTFWWTLGAVAAACLLAVVAVLLRRRRAASDAEVVFVDPLSAFRGALDALASSDDPLRLIAGLSLALRRYLGNRVGFPAAESTTTEVRRRLQERGLPAGLILEIDRLLKHCDAVKFARRPIERAACDEPLAAAARVCEHLERHLRPAPEEADSEREAA